MLHSPAAAGAVFPGTCICTVPGHFHSLPIHHTDAVGIFMGSDISAAQLLAGASPAPNAARMPGR